MKGVQKVNKKIKIIMVFLIILGTSFVAFTLFTNSSEASLSEEEAKELVQSQYGGIVKTIKKTNENGTYKYIMSMDTKKGEYEVVLDSNTRKITKMLLVKSNDKRAHTIEEAKLAIEKSTGGTVTDIKKEIREGKSIAIGTVKLDTEQKRVIYSLIDKKIIDSNVTNNNASSDPNGNQITLIPKEQAIKIAQAKVNGTVKQVQLVDTKKGQQYKVTIDNGIEGAHVFVPANSGKNVTYEWYQKDQPPSNQVIPSDQDDDNDDDNDDSDDD